MTCKTCDVHDQLVKFSDDHEYEKAIKFGTSYLDDNANHDSGMTQCNNYVDILMLLGKMLIFKDRRGDSKYDITDELWPSLQLDCPPPVNISQRAIAHLLEAADICEEPSVNVNHRTQIQILWALAYAHAWTQNEESIGKAIGYFIKCELIWSRAVGTDELVSEKDENGWIQHAAMLADYYTRFVPFSMSYIGSDKLFTLFCGFLKRLRSDCSWVKNGDEYFLVTQAFVCSSFYSSNYAMAEDAAVVMNGKTFPSLRDIVLVSRIRMGDKIEFTWDSYISEPSHAYFAALFWAESVLRGDLAARDGSEIVLKLAGPLAKSPHFPEYLCVFVELLSCLIEGSMKALLRAVDQNPEWLIPCSVSRLVECDPVWTPLVAKLIFVFQGMIRNVNLESMNKPDALLIKLFGNHVPFIRDSISMIHVPRRNRFCGFCFVTGNHLGLCRGCVCVFYCSNVCASKDWYRVHRDVCETLAKQ